MTFITTQYFGRNDHLGFLLVCNFLSNCYLDELIKHNDTLPDKQMTITMIFFKESSH